MNNTVKKYGTFRTVSLHNLKPTEYFLWKPAVEYWKEKIEEEGVVKKPIFMPQYSILIDGNHKTFAMYLLGYTEVECELKPDIFTYPDGMTPQDLVSMCDQHGVRSITDLSDHVCESKEYRRRYKEKMSEFFNIDIPTERFERVMRVIQETIHMR
jgi:hypothetical protein